MTLRNGRLVLVGLCVLGLPSHLTQSAGAQVPSGPVVTTLEYEPGAGTKAARIVSIANDIARMLRAQSVRVIPALPGRSTVGIEIPSEQRSVIRFGDVVKSARFRSDDLTLPVALGVDTFGSPVIEDLVQMPHLLLAGTTGSGKSVFINNLIAGLLCRKSAKEMRFVFIDPKMVELAGEVADGALLLVGLQPDAVGAAQRLLQEGARRAGRSLSGFPIIFIAPIALEDSLGAARRWPQRWFAPGHPWLTYPSRSNLYWLRQGGLTLPDEPTPEAIPDDLAASICDAFGLFGPPERCLDRLLRAREEAGVEHVFLFPAHTLEGGYDMPVREVEAFHRVIRPRL